MMKEMIKRQARNALAEGWDAVLGLKRRWGQIGPHLFTDPDELEKIELDPKYCLAKTIRSMLKRWPALRVAAVIRGCDVRALRELEKMGVFSSKRLYVIGIPCSPEQAEECNCEKPIYETLSCVGCWKCIDVCPEEAIERINVCPILVDSEWNEGLSKRKAVYIPFPQAMPLKAIRDSEHCLKLKGILECKGCEAVCEAKAIIHDDEEKIEEIDVGTIIVATGFKIFDPAPLTHYGFGRYPEVYTSLQFERLNNATGPTEGKIQTKDGRVPAKVAIIHCVGSRDQNYNKYCSRVCCMYSMKFAHLVKEKVGAEVYEFYIDIRSPGKGYEEFYNRLQEEGTHFIRGKVAEVTDIVDDPADEGRLTVVAEDTLARKIRRIPVDMVVLSVGLQPADGVEDVARMVGISQDSDGWINELHPKLGPLATPSDGIFIAGCCQGPKDIPDTVAQAQGAAVLALSLISRGKIEIDPIVAAVNERLCTGCKTCVELCVYSAVSFIEEKKSAFVNDILCKGCGTCAAACPVAAISVQHFTPDQIFAEIEGILA